MNMCGIGSLYKEDRLSGFQLKNKIDLLKTHGMDFKVVNGSNRLDDLNKVIYENYIFSKLRLEFIVTLTPRKIYFV